MDRIYVPHMYFVLEEVHMSGDYHAKCIGPWYVLYSKDLYVIQLMFICFVESRVFRFFIGNVSEAFILFLYSA